MQLQIQDKRVVLVLATFGRRELHLNRSAIQDLINWYRSSFHDCRRKIFPDETLIIFYETPDCPKALKTLKYFEEKAKDYHVIATGILLGALPAKPKFYPVGMINLLDISPPTFDEFLIAVDPPFYDYYVSRQRNQQIEDIFQNRHGEL